MPELFRYNPNDPAHDELVRRKREEVRRVNRACRRHGIPKRIRLTYKPKLDERHAWKYEDPRRKSVRLEDAREVVVYWSHARARGGDEPR